MDEKKTRTIPTIMAQADEIERLEKRLACADIVIEIMREADTVMREGIEKLRTDGLGDRLCVLGLSKIVEKLWVAVAEGKYDSRSIVGDAVLDMVTMLTDNGIDATGKENLL